MDIDYKALAAKLREKAGPEPRMSMTVADYTVAYAVHSLIEALEAMAE